MDPSNHIVFCDNTDYSTVFHGGIGMQLTQQDIAQMSVLICALHLPFLLWFVANSETNDFVNGIGQRAGKQ